VVAGTPGRRGTGGRYHLTDLCWTIPRGVPRRQTTLFLAAAAGHWPCPYCAAALPACCRSGDHTKSGYAALPVLPAPEPADWERELELREEPDGQ
jgi:hypothetical protein